MAKFIIQIEDADDEVRVQAMTEPALTPEQVTFSTAQLVGLYLREHMADILKAAVAWAKEPEPVEQPAIAAPKLVLPGGVQ